MYSCEQLIHCVIKDMECSCDAWNKLWDFGLGRNFSLLDGCVDLHCELINSFSIQEFGICREGELDVFGCLTNVFKVLGKVLNTKNTFVSLLDRR